MTAKNQEPKPQVGFIGMGQLGTCMALQLVEAGYPFSVFDRKPEKMQPLSQRGARTTDSPKALAAECDIVLSCVTNDTAAEAVMLGEQGALAGAKANTILVDMSTVSPQTSRRIYEAAKERGISMIDAAVSGSTPQAKEASLVIFVGGDKETYQKCKPLFEVLGKANFYMGSSGMGTTMKLVVNTLLGLGLQAVAEAIVLGEKAGLERNLLLDVLGQTAVIAPAHKSKLENAQNNEYPANFALPLMYKDFSLILQQATELSVPMPATAAAQQICAIAQAKGVEDDYSAVIRVMEELTHLSSLSTESGK